MKLYFFQYFYNYVFTEPSANGINYFKKREAI